MADGKAIRGMLLTSPRQQRLLAWILIALLIVTLSATSPWLIMESDRSLWRSTARYLLLLGQIAILSVAIGRWIERPILRWALYGGCLLLVDLWVFGAAGLGYRGDPFHQAYVFRHAFGSSLVALILIFVALSTHARAWNLPMVVLLIAPVTYWMLTWFDQGYGSTMGQILSLGQILAVLAVVGALRTRGYRIDSNERLHDADRTAPRARPHFSLQHLFYWLLTLCVVLTSVRVFGLPARYYTDADTWVQSVLLVIEFMGVVWLAVWVTLGTRPHAIPVVGMFLAALAVGIAGQAMIALWMHVQYPRFSVGVFFESQRVLGWVTWPVLTGSSLACLLVAFRTSGYRLHRLPAQTINTVQSAE